MYYFTFFLFALCAFLNISGKLDKQKVQKLLLFASIWMIVHDGLRWGIGTDWRPYLFFFNNCLWTDEENFDWGYKIFNLLVRSFTDKYTVFLVLHAVFVYAVFYKFIKRYSPYPLLSFLVLYYSMLSYLGMNRQYIAIVLCLLSVPFILKKEYFKGGSIVVIASLFHMSALMFFVVFFLNREFKNITFLSLLVLVTVLALSRIVDKLPLDLFLFLGNSGDKMNTYMIMGDEVASSTLTTLLGIIKRGFWFIMLLYFRKRLVKIYSCFNFVINVVFVALFFYILFSGTILQVIVGRGLIYFNIFSILSIPFIIAGMRRLLLKQFFFILVFFWGIYSFNKGMDYYKGGRGEDIFRPYNAVYINSDYDATGYTFEK